MCPVRTKEGGDPDAIRTRDPQIRNVSSLLISLILSFKINNLQNITLF